MRFEILQPLSGQAHVDWAGFPRGRDGQFVYVHVPMSGAYCTPRMGDQLAQSARKLAPPFVPLFWKARPACDRTGWRV